MPNRIIKESIRTSRDVNNLTDFQFRVWAYLITYVDDYGRGSADPELLKGLVFPRRKGITEQQISDALSALASMGMISFYNVDGELYFCFPTWEKHQRIRNSRGIFPEPCGEPPRVAASCGEPPRVAARIQSNPIQSESNPNPNPNTNSARSRFTPPTVEEVQAYCRARGNRVDAERFVDFYTANGWIQGKGKPIKDWKACARTWEQRDGGKVKGDDYSGISTSGGGDKKAKSQENPDEVFAAYPDLRARYAGYCQECAQNGQEPMSASEFLALQKPGRKAGGEYAEVY